MTIVEAPPAGRFHEPADRERWDGRYADGLYAAAPPTGFVVDVMAAAEVTDLPVERGLYIGCGNGRNYLPLVAAGLSLVGLDVSGTALSQIRTHRPELATMLVHGDLDALPAGEEYGVVIGLHVFHHGTGERAVAHLRAAASRVAVGGLLCVRVNAAEVEQPGPVGARPVPTAEHETVATGPGSGRSVRWTAGPAAGAVEHLFAADELAAAVDGRHEPIAGPRRVPAADGDATAQWEAIWKRIA